MAFRLLRRLSGLGQLNATQNSSMHLHKNYVIDNRKNFTSKPQNVCPNKACNKKEKKKSLWRKLFELKQEEDKRPPIECCRSYRENAPKTELDLSELGGDVYKTCGSAYLVQKDLLATREKGLSREDALVKRMEVDPQFKDTLEDPLPQERSAELRLLELSDKKLHPLYRRYANIKKQYLQKQDKLYKTVRWPVDMHEIPARLNINTELLEKKNMYLEFKRIEPPRQLVGRIVELNKNARPTLERKQVPVDMEDIEKKQSTGKTKNSVYDTLYQNDTKF